MTKQKPTIGIEDFERVKKEDHGHEGRSSPLACVPWRHNRQYPGETPKDAANRLKREREIQQDREWENRRDYDGRIRPVFID